MVFPFSSIRAIETRSAIEKIQYYYVIPSFSPIDGKVNNENNLKTI